MQVLTTKDVGALIREARRARTMTQAELAQRAGVTRRWLSDIEQGTKQRAELGLVLAALQAAGVRLDASVPGIPDAQQDTAARAPETEIMAADHGVDLDDALDRYLSD